MRPAMTAVSDRPAPTPPSSTSRDAGPSDRGAPIRIGQDDRHARPAAGLFTAGHQGAAVPVRPRLYRPRFPAGGAPPPVLHPPYPGDVRTAAGGPCGPGPTHLAPP